MKFNMQVRERTNTWVEENSRPEIRTHAAACDWAL